MGSDPVQEERERSVRKCTPDIFSGKYKSVLYVGANQKRQHFLQYFQESNYNQIVLVEAFHENVIHLKEKYEKKFPQIYKVIEGDIRNVEEFNLPNFDVVFFWHGIEHLSQDDIQPTLSKLEKITENVFPR